MLVKRLRCHVYFAMDVPNLPFHKIFDNYIFKLLFYLRLGKIRKNGYCLRPSVEGKLQDKHLPRYEACVSR